MLRERGLLLPSPKIAKGERNERLLPLKGKHYIHNIWYQVKLIAKPHQSINNSLCPYYFLSINPLVTCVKVSSSNIEKVPTKICSHTIATLSWATISSLISDIPKNLKVIYSTIQSFQANINTFSETISTHLLSFRMVKTTMSMRTGKTQEV